MKVTVVMPFRDAAATLPAALASVRAQTFPHWELLAVDDHSRDGSREVVAAVAAADPRVRLLTNEDRPGVAGASRTAGRAAAGEWLVRMDADDVSRPERIERQLAVAAAHPDWDVIGCGVTIPNPLGEGMVRYVEWVNGLQGPEEIAAARFIESPVVHPSAMMRRAAVAAAGGYREVAWAEDHDLWLRMLEAGCRFGKTPEVLLEWRDSPGRLTRADAAYGEAARQRMRAHFLARLPVVAERGVALAGAGPIGKELARALRAEGVAVQGFYEVHPRRIGERIQGVEVADSAELGRRWPAAVLVSTVGVPGGREQVRALALAAGYREGRDFWCAC